MNDCFHGMGRADWCSICTPPRIPSKPRTKKEHRKRKPLIFKGKASPQEVIVFETVVRVVEKIKTVTEVRRVLVPKEVTCTDYTPLWKAILDEKAKRPYLSLRELARIFNTNKSSVGRVLKHGCRTQPKLGRPKGSRNRVTT